MSLELKLRQVEKRRLTEEIVDRLVSLIASGKLKPGDRLPPERELMQQLGVGRSSLREAIGSLSLTGVLTVRPGSGTFVTLSHEEFLAKPLGWGIPMGPGRVQELIEARRILEQAIVALAAERASETEIAEMKRHLLLMNTSRRNRRKFIKADMTFHATLAKASHNNVLQSLFLQIRNLLRSFTEKILLVPGAYDSVISGHGEIFSAIEARDVEGARSALGRHLDLVSDILASVAVTTTPSDVNHTGEVKPAKASLKPDGASEKEALKCPGS
jgi:GntR family transcriptional repressor for pyruvate dehydrogenase complex